MHPCEHRPNELRHVGDLERGFHLDQHLITKVFLLARGEEHIHRFAFAPMARNYVDGVVEGEKRYENLLQSSLLALELIAREADERTAVYDWSTAILTRDDAQQFMNEQGWR